MWLVWGIWCVDPQNKGILLQSLTASGPCQPWACLSQGRPPTRINVMGACVFRLNPDISLPLHCVYTCISMRSQFNNRFAPYILCCTSNSGGKGGYTSSKDNNMRWALGFMWLQREDEKHYLPKNRTQKLLPWGESHNWQYHGGEEWVQTITPCPRFPSWLLMHNKSAVLI